jgi:hypothetical protein
VLEKDLILCQPYNQVYVWIGDKKIDIENIKNLHGGNGQILVEFDESVERLWVISFSNDYKNILFFDITNGVVPINNPISVEMPYAVGFYVKLNNNQCLFETGNLQYEIIDIITRERKTIKISRIDGNLPMEYPSSPLGFYDNKIVFWNGFYDTTDDKYVHFPNKPINPRFMAKEYSLIYLNEKNFLFIYNFDNMAIEPLLIKRKKRNFARYNGNDLFYKNKDCLYISKDIGGIGSIFSQFFPIWYTKRKWYKLDLQTNKQSRIFVPSDQVIILGKIRN